VATSWFARNGERLAVWTLAALVVLASVGVYLLVPYSVDGAAVDAVAEDPALVVEETGSGVLVRPANGETAGGLAFYPGALVPTEAYVPLAGRIAEEAGLAVSLVDVPLNLAVLDVDAADGALGGAAGVERWYVGGHSLGGAMACRYAGGNADRLAGVVLVGAYCDVDVSGSDLDVLTLVGTRDGIVNRDALARSRTLVPADARFVDVAGTNHTQVGVYSGQSDTPATVSGATARLRYAEAVAAWVGNRSVEESGAPARAPGRASLSMRRTSSPMSSRSK
jgi:dienelactone hydrolase